MSSSEPKLSLSWSLGFFTSPWLVFARKVKSKADDLKRRRTIQDWKGIKDKVSSPGKKKKRCENLLSSLLCIALESNKNSSKLRETQSRTSAKYYHFWTAIYWACHVCLDNVIIHMLIIFYLPPLILQTFNLQKKKNGMWIKQVQLLKKKSGLELQMNFYIIKDLASICKI